MKRQTTTALALLAIGAMLDCGSARAQARGPAAEEVREHGQYIAPPPGGYVRATELIGGWREIPIGEDPPDVEDSALGPPGELDAATRLAQIAKLETWLTRLPGRFRIKGRVEKTVYVAPDTPKVLSGDVTGIADCVSVGEGVAVKCILSAAWPDIDENVADIGSRPTDSESLKTLQPGVLFMGLNLDPPGIRSMLVTDDSIAHTWAGRLTENTLRADRLTDCRDGEDPPDFRCLQPFEVLASPDSENYSIILRRFRRTPMQSEPLPPEFPRTLTITINMVRDPEARAEKPMQTKKVR